ncbi:MAG: outer membrane protein assembly factor BamA [Planctomycetota bacterium]
MRAALLVALLVACSGTAVVAAAERQVTVTEVRIEGCKTVNPERISFVLSVRAGRRYGLEFELLRALSDDVRAIMRMGPFTDPRPTIIPGSDPDKVSVVISVVELPYVTGVSFKGLESQWGAEGELSKKMEIKTGGYANPLLVENDLHLIERHFRDLGRRGTTARAESVATPSGIAMIFVVDLPPAVQVGRVAYRGLPADMRRRRLDDILDRTQVNRPGRAWQPEVLDIDQQDVRRALQDEGWLDCRLNGIDVEHTDYVRPADPRRRGGPEFVPDGAYNDRVHLIYDLQPGERYRLGTVSFIGNTQASSAELLEAFAIATGAWYRNQDIARGLERARRVISNRGYARCFLSPDRRLNLVTHTVDLVVRIDEGRPYRVGRVDIYGNLATRDSVIRRNLFVQPGQLWNDDDIDESRRQILRGGLFLDEPQHSLNVRSLFPEDRPDQVDIRIDLDERSTGSISASVSYSVASGGISGRLSYSEDNFDLWGAITDPGRKWRGGGQRLNADIFVAQTTNNLSLAWSNPSLADGPYSEGVRLSRTDSTQRDWQEDRLEAADTIGRNFFRNNLHLGFSYTYSDIDISHIGLAAPDDATSGHRFQNQLGASLSFDSLDNSILPTSGLMLSASDNVAGAITSASDNYNEYQLKCDGYLPLLESEDGGVTFLYLGARWRQISPIDTSTAVPFYQRYLGGGPAPRFRGVGYNQLGPRATNKNGLDSRLGGDRDFVSSAELSYPVLGYNESLRMIGFLDAGNVWGVGETASLGSLRYAWGFGLRFPMQFPISLDFAWLVHPEPGESKSQVQFGLGAIRF